MNQREIKPNNTEHRRRRRERFAILAVMLVIAIITYLEVHFLNYGVGLPLSNSVLFFALLNINSTLLLLLIFLVIRNLVKLIFERKQGILGSRLRTRLVVAFTSLSLIPTLLLFFLSLQFISSSVEHWFNLNVERSLQNSLDLGTAYYQETLEDTLRKTGRIAGVLEPSLASPKTAVTSQEILRQHLEQNDLSFLALIPPGDLTWTVAGAETARAAVASQLSSGAIRKPAAFSEPRVELVSGVEEEWVTAIVPITSLGSPGSPPYILAAARRIPPELLDKMERVSHGYESYKQAILLKTPLKITHYIILSIVTLMILFFATWYGFYLSREMTEPIRDLADGTNRVASGDYDVQIPVSSKDEIGMLVASFNMMARDLKQHKLELERTNQELLARNLEMEERKQHTETVLRNVAAGVISVDSKGRVTTFNTSAERMLNIRAEHILNREVGDFMIPPYDHIIQSFLDELNLLKTGSVEHHVKIPMGSSLLSLLVKINLLKDDEGHYMGMVVVFDDLSQIEKAQRINAWREVARRIAHEIKNPLTPIQLCAQRLQRRYGSRFPQDGQVFEECTATIVRQVEELKKLVNEFSGFARMPSANPSLNSLDEVIREVLPLYRQSHKHIHFVYEPKKPLPEFNLDREQMTRVFVNLLDNAVAAVDSKQGRVVVTTDYDPILKMARIEFADNGPGIRPEDRPRLFEPYFSTKKSGMGLGLAIVNTIIQDHDGFIRVLESDSGGGSRFVIELPVRS